MRALAAIDHVKIVRVAYAGAGRRARSDHAATSCARLKAPGKATYVVLHANHARELTPAARAACAHDRRCRHSDAEPERAAAGVNDDAATLEALMRALVENRIKPYYLHHADLAPGTSHFRTTIADGQALMRGLRARASGLCQPTYVLDIPGGDGKVPVGPCYTVENTHTSQYVITDERGERHIYPPRSRLPNANA